MRLFRRRQHPALKIVISLEPRALTEREPAKSAESEDGQIRIVIPSDVLLASYRRLFPAERMLILGGYLSGREVTASSMIDVTEKHPSIAHVRACPERLGQALVDLERCGAHLAVWIHSHPGEGPVATHPSSTDLSQDRDLRRDYSKNLIGIIVVRDGWLRIFGQAIENNNVTVQFRGSAIETHKGDSNVYRIKIS